MYFVIEDLRLKRYAFYRDSTAGMLIPLHFKITALQRRISYKISNKIEFFVQNCQGLWSKFQDEIIIYRVSQKNCSTFD